MLNGCDLLYTPLTVQCLNVFHCVCVAGLLVFCPVHLHLLAALHDGGRPAHSWTGGSVNYTLYLYLISHAKMANGICKGTLICNFTSAVDTEHVFVYVGVQEVPERVSGPPEASVRDGEQRRSAHDHLHHLLRHLLQPQH